MRLGWSAQTEGGGCPSEDPAGQAIHTVPSTPRHPVCFLEFGERHVPLLWQRERSQSSVSSYGLEGRGRYRNGVVLLNYT